MPACLGLSVEPTARHVAASGGRRIKQYPTSAPKLQVFSNYGLSGGELGFGPQEDKAKMLVVTP